MNYKDTLKLACITFPLKLLGVFQTQTQSILKFWIMHRENERGKEREKRIDSVLKLKVFFTKQYNQLSF